MQAAAEPLKLSQTQPPLQQQQQQQRQEQQQSALPDASVGQQDIAASNTSQQQADVGNSMQQTAGTSLHVEAASLPDPGEVRQSFCIKASDLFQS